MEEEAFKILLVSMADWPQEYASLNSKVTTNSIEGFHGMALKYCSKRIDLKHVYIAAKPTWQFAIKIRGDCEN